MKQVIILCHSEEELARLNAVTTNDKFNYKVIRHYHRAEWNSGKITKPYISHLVSCKTPEEEFLLRLKFKTLDAKPYVI